MATLLPGDLSGRALYHLMISSIVPRPIAWTTSVSPAGLVNCAPFSFFNGISSKPPLVSICVGRRRDGTKKDTWANVEATEEFVVHVVDEAHGAQMVETSVAFAPDVSEVAEVGLKTLPSQVVKVPRLAEASVAMECVLRDVYMPPGATTAMLVGEVVAWHVADGLLKPGPMGVDVIDVHRLRPLGRLGGRSYAPVRDVFDMEPPE